MINLKKKRILVIAPHADDETIGCGGTVLRLLEEGNEVHWLLVTRANRGVGFEEKEVSERNKVIENVFAFYKFSSITKLEFDAARLDTVPKQDLINALESKLKQIEPQVMFLPFKNDSHSDHGQVFDAACALSKWFRYPSVETTLAYETCSETDFDLDPTSIPFKPNFFVDISKYMDKKLEVLKLYEREIGKHPFPRSTYGVKALNSVRGASSGCSFAEAFIILRCRM